MVPSLVEKILRPEVFVHYVCVVRNRVLWMDLTLGRHMGFSHKRELRKEMLPMLHLTLLMGICNKYAGPLDRDFDCCLQVRYKLL